ncbi:hypothetical protein Tco_1375854 [Tanacetum coccineum]
MHTRASNYELVEPLPEPERILNRRRRRQNRRVLFDQRNNPPKNPRIVYPPILNINHFRHFLNTLENLFPMDDEPMWAADRVVAPTPGFAITIPETANEFAIKGTISIDSTGTSEEISQDCIVMLIWKDTSYFDSPTKDVDNGEPKTVDDAKKQVKDGPNNVNTEQDKFADDSSTKDDNAAGQHVNTASPDVNTGVSSTLEATHIESFSDEDEP